MLLQNSFYCLRTLPSEARIRIKLDWVCLHMTSVNVGKKNKNKTNFSLPENPAAAKV